MRFFIVVKRLNGESKFRLAVFRRNFFEFELSFRAEGEARSREICILLDFSMRSFHSLSRNDREEKLSVFLYIMTSEYLPKSPFLKKLQRSKQSEAREENLREFTLM